MYCGIMFSLKTKPNVEITITVSIGNTCIVSILLRGGHSGSTGGLTGSGGRRAVSTISGSGIVS